MVKNTNVTERSEVTQVSDEGADGAVLKTNTGKSQHVQQADSGGYEHPTR
jgi:hypothetical protein